MSCVTLQREARLSLQLLEDAEAGLRRARSLVDTFRDPSDASGPNVDIAALLSLTTGSRTAEEVRGDAGRARAFARSCDRASRSLDHNEAELDGYLTGLDASAAPPAAGAGPASRIAGSLRRVVVG